ncbi:5-oxoprolinase subunit C family protein [Desulfosoma caldarium]|uniref:Antagonist of KipI n=1 Tax=Desulfosoma caldarium TaxID=610254 RepID=A0A3N1VLS9_9BACT|nr:biotin-dependent carboxyltransferase family protein [Desulfosoma caldarium]ROR02999.1 antagonist of KipI [Desulfosoma caldarium]
MKTLHIEEAGLLTTVQDGGRYGYQDKGVPVSGAMDTAALKLGNALLGNPPDAAALEISMGGFRARFLAHASFAVTGFDPQAYLNDHPVPSWTAWAAEPGDVLELRAGSSGIWHYVCLAGGLDVPLVLGSRSTYLRGRFGGLDGRALRRGDVLATGSRQRVAPKRLPEALRPPYRDHPTIRVILGPQEDAFVPESIHAFLSAPYHVTPRSDRMGMMLDGPRLRHRRSADIISEGLAFGAIQVPGQGLPFVLLADRPTTGGYAKIATVFSLDLPLLVQTAPGRLVRFQSLSLLEARELYLKHLFAFRRFLERHERGGDAYS